MGEVKSTTEEKLKKIKINTSTEVETVSVVEKSGKAHTLLTPGSAIADDVLVRIAMFDLIFLSISLIDTH